MCRYVGWFSESNSGSFSPSLRIANELKEELIAIYNSDITSCGGMRKMKKRMQRTLRRPQRDCIRFFIALMPPHEVMSLL